MIRLALFAAAVLAAAAPAAAAPATVVDHLGPVTITKDAAPHRKLVIDVIVPARRDSVWAAFTTTAGLDSWLWKDCSVDLKKGGGWTVRFSASSTGGGTIVNIKDGRAITIHALAPDTFPTVRRVGTTAEFSFDAVGDTATAVRLTQTGWRDGDEWDKAYDYLAKGNAQLLGQLRYRFKVGPIDWAAAEKSASASPAK